LKRLAVTVPVAVRNDDGLFAMTTCRRVYSAPRLLRDRIRETDGTYEQDWAQPMMRALFEPAAEGKANTQQLAGAAVELMPDFDNKGKLRFLLNFPLTLDEGGGESRDALAKRKFGERMTKKRGRSGCSSCRGKRGCGCRI
jgi:hypothetical protein